MITRQNILQEAVERCLNELYQRAQPKITWNKIKELSKKGHYDNENPFYEQHYISNEEYEDIVNGFVHAYDLYNNFKDNCDIVYDYLENGGNKDVFIKTEDGSPIRREVEKTPRLSEVIGEEHAKICLDLITSCKNYFRGERGESGFRFEVSNYAPTSNKETVINYWKNKGKKIQIKDRHFDEEENEWTF